MSPSPFQQLLSHRRSLALATLLFWGLCALLAGCLIGLNANSESSPMASAMAHEHAGHHAQQTHAGHGGASESFTDLACCETGHDPVPLTLLGIILLAVGLPLAFLLPLLLRSGAVWWHQQFSRFRIRPPRYHLVYCSFLH